MWNERIREVRILSDHDMWHLWEHKHWTLNRLWLYERSVVFIYERYGDFQTSVHFQQHQPIIIIIIINVNASQ